MTQSPSKPTLNATLQQIAHQLEQSKHWQPINRASMAFERFEGTLPETQFNPQFLAALSPYQTTLDQFEQTFACGFEIEFYLEPKQLPDLQQQFAAILPESQMLLIELDKVVATNGLNFYLMAENTGKPASGLQSYEIVSPILDAKALPYFIEKILSLLQRFEAQDDEHLGFHLHVSTPNSEPISPLALIYFLDQAKVFDWQNRQFTRDIVQQFFNYRPEAWRRIFKEITRKCYNLNLLRYPDDNRIELRSAGGNGYLQDANKLIATSFDTLCAYEKASRASHQAVAAAIFDTYQLNTALISTVDHSVESLASQQQATWLSHYSPNS